MPSDNGAGEDSDRGAEEVARKLAAIQVSMPRLALSQRLLEMVNGIPAAITGRRYTLASNTQTVWPSTRVAIC
jgi:hypothetical protein